MRAVDDELAAGARLGGYVLEGVVGRGANGVVYAARDERLDRRVALKVLPAPVSAAGAFRARLLAESRLAAAIDHPHVIPVYEAGVAEECVFIAMQLVSGTDLRELLAGEASLEPARALPILGQVASALDAAHARGLLHRDVKPGNILLAAGEEGRDHAYLTDFGLAVRDADGFEGGRFAGSADYVAPEQIEGRAEASSDLYSLACVLFECLAGEPPFGRRRLLEQLWCHLHEQPPLLSERRGDVPAAADGLLAAALAKEPAHRPGSCGELVAAAREAFEPARSTPRRRRAALAAALVAAVVAAAAAGALRLGAGDGVAAGAGATIDTVAGTGAAVSSGDGGPALKAGLKGPFSIAVDEGGNVYVSEEEGTRVRRIDADDGRITTVAGTGRAGHSGDGGPATRAAISQVGLAVDRGGRLHLLQWTFTALRRLREDGTIETVAGTGQGGALLDAPRTRSPDLCHRPVGPAFDPAGRVYVACTTAHRVIRLDAPDSFTVVAGTSEPGFSGDGGPATRARLHEPAAIAIDGEGNLFIADSMNHRIRRVDPDGTITTVAGTGRPGFSGDGWSATAVDLWLPIRVRVDGAGNLYVVEAATYRVRKVDRAGRITTVAGSGRRGYAGDGGPAGAAALAGPVDIAVDADGNLWIADYGNHRVRKVTP